MKIDLNKQAKEILKRAQEKGVENSYLFITTFRRYQEHVAHLMDLEEALQEDGLMVTKEYVKGRENIYVHPAVTAYNQTAGAADKTAQLLLKYIVQPLGDDKGGDSFDVF